MEFFKKRSTAWVLFAITVVACFFIGQSNRPGKGTGPDSIVEMPSGIYIQDRADILSDSTEKHITQLNNGLVSKLGAEIQVITIDTAMGKDMMDLADEYGESLNLSPVSAVFLIAVDDVDAVIVMGYDLYSAPKNIFDPERLSDLLVDNFTVSDFEHRRLDSDVKDAFDDLIEKYEQYYRVDIPAMKNVQKTMTTTTTTTYSYTSSLLAYLIFVAFILLIVYMLTKPRRRTVVNTYNTGYNRGYNNRNNYPPRGSYTTPPYNSGSRSGGFSGTRTSGSYTTTTHTTTRTTTSYGSSSRSGGFSSSSRSSSSSSRGGSFSSSSRSSSSRSRGGSRGGSFRK